MRYWYFVALCLGVIVGCKTRRSNSDPQAYVSNEHALEALQIIKGLDYIPFEYTIDGCYARAYYMMMELAVKKIPSSAQFVSATKGLLRYDKASWSFHVAPMLIPSRFPETEIINDSFLNARVSRAEIDLLSARPMIVDPGITSKPLSLPDWLKTFVQEGTEVRLAAIPPSYYTNPPKWNLKQHLIRNFDELPSFSLKDINHACGVLKDYQKDELRQAKLLKRTHELIDQLRALNKISDTNGDEKWVFNEECPFPFDDIYRRK
jgi:hypothetical protein